MEMIFRRLSVVACLFAAVMLFVNCIDKPDTPKPDDTDQPTQTEPEPDTPENPDDPNNPGDPNNPDDPNTPDTPVVPDEDFVLPETIKILAIGNSFSEDAVEQELYGLFNAVGKKVIIGNMYIGGCDLVKHVTNAKNDNAAYSYRKIVNGSKTTTSGVKLSTALTDEDWTFVSIQDGAGFHGFYDTTYNGVTHSMEPNLTTMLTYIKEKCPGAKLMYHAPWAAKQGFTSNKFAYYDNNQKLMYEMICTATQAVEAAHPELMHIMNSMDVIQNARSSYIGDNLTRDGWHLSYSAGRYTASCLWFEKIMGQSVVGNTYHPESLSDTRALVCQTAAHMACVNPYKVTDLSYIEAPEDEVVKPHKVLAKWYFSPTRTVNDGGCKSWTGQTELGVYRTSNQPGERGYYNANESGSGKLSYVQVDKTQWTEESKLAGLSILDVSNGGQPVMRAPMAGDYWQFETTGGNHFAEGTKLHIIYTYNPGDYGAKYWRIEYKDGNSFKPVPSYELKTTTIEKSGETIQYNQAFDKNQRIIEFTVTLENRTDEFVVRQICCSAYQINDKWFGYPNSNCVSRIAGDPNNDAKPLPQMDQLL